VRWRLSAFRSPTPLHQGFGELKAADVVFSFHRGLDPKTGGPMRSSVEIIKEINALIDVAEHTKFHDYHLKNLPPHMALVGGVELPHA
jgi:hypothetical protein